MSNIYLEDYSSSKKVIWDSIVNNSKNGNFLHCRDYIGYHSNRFDERSVIAFKKGSPIAVFPCNLSGKELISHAGLSYAGLIYLKEIKLLDIVEIMNLIIDKFSKEGCESIVYKSIPYIFHRYPAGEDLYSLFKVGATLYRRDVSTVIKLKDRIRYSDSRKNTIKKAILNGVTVEKNKEYAEFYDLVSAALQRHGVAPVHSEEEIRLLAGKFDDSINLFCAYKDGNLLSAVLVYDFGHVVHTQYMASNDIGKKCGALDYLLSHLIDVEYSDREYFDFGISTENDGQKLNSGLVFQKEGFGGRAVVHDFYRISL